MTFSIGDLVAILAVVVTVIGAIAGGIVWTYSTFITRREAAQMEKAIDRIIAEFRKPITAQLEKFEKKLDDHLARTS